jgi:dimethylamine/trimethylamine dehydrogenase
VIVATGSSWAGDGLHAVTHEPIPGADASFPHVLTPEQVVLEGKRPTGGRVVVYDGEGYVIGCGVAELLALEDHQVELVTPFDVVAPLCNETLEGPELRRHLHDVGVVTRRNHTVVRIQQGRVELESDFGETVELGADAIVLVTQRLSDDALYQELVADAKSLAAEGIEAVYRIGDCVAPRQVADAIFDGHRLGREIDSENPAVPLPHRRELPSATRV